MAANAKSGTKVRSATVTYRPHNQAHAEGHVFIVLKRGHMIRLIGETPMRQGALDRYGRICAKALARHLNDSRRSGA